jgi:hypothetical protein
MLTFNIHMETFTTNLTILYVEFIKIFKIKIYKVFT